MRICLYDWALHSIGGGQKFDCKIAEHLSKKHDVDILSLFPVSRKQLEKAYAVDFSRIRNFRYLYRQSKINATFLHLLSFRKVSEIAAEYDLFFNADAHETVKPNARKNVMYCHFFGLKWPEPARNPKQFASLVLNFAIKTIFRNYAMNYDRVYCNSLYTKKWLKKKWKVDAEVIYPPIDIPTKATGKKKNIMLSVGRLTPDKNYEFTIECFKELYDSGIKNYECWVYGSGPPTGYYEKLKKLAKGYPVKIIVNPSHRELEKAYSISKIFVQAKGLGINEQKYPALLEHFGMTPVEAMAYCCVPVLLNKAGYKESVQNGKSGFLFNTKDEAIEKLKLLVKNEKLLQRMGMNARARAKKFSLGRMQKQIDEAIEKVIKSK